jgi:glycerate-2-kinase
MGYVKNADQLLSHGNIKARKTAIDIIEYGLARADPDIATRELISMQGDILHVAELKFDLTQYKRIYLLGAGKATYPIARALEDILGDRISGGVIACKYGQPGTLSRAELIHASHPIPDEFGFAASQKALSLAAQTQKDDIVFGCITGGSSALFPFPAEGITLKEKQAVNRLLLTCGANIVEINAVRKHLSQIKGGRLAKAIHPQAELINLTVSDVIGDPLDYITDPTVPDTSTFDDAKATMTKYDLWSKVPSSVSQFLNRADPELESPKEKDFAGYHRHDFILVKGDTACVGASERAKALGFNSMILSTMLEGESSELGRTFASIAKEIVLSKRPIESPCVIIGGGETTVKIGDEYGLGGPNQEFALSAACEIAGLDEVLIGGIDSDGTDGPTDFAGALVDGGTLTRAQAAGVDVHASLKRHRVTETLQALGDIVQTGATGTNVNDLKMLVVMSAGDSE